VERLDLDRFDQGEISDLLMGSLGSNPADDLVEQIYRRSGGTPSLPRSCWPRSGRKTAIRSYRPVWRTCC
jgi:hypothetical protein